MLWEEDVLYRATAMIRAEIEEGAERDPADFITISWNTATNEADQYHFVDRGTPGNFQFVGSPSATAQPYQAYFHTNERTRDPVEGKARLRPTLNFRNTHSWDGRGGAEPAVVESFVVEKLAIPDFATPPEPTPIPTPEYDPEGAPRRVGFHVEADWSQVEPAPAFEHRVAATIDAYFVADVSGAGAGQWTLSLDYLKIAGEGALPAGWTAHVVGYAERGEEPDPETAIAEELADFGQGEDWDYDEWFGDDSGSIAGFEWRLLSGLVTLDSRQFAP